LPPPPQPTLPCVAGKPLPFEAFFPSPPPPPPPSPSPPAYRFPHPTLSSNLHECMERQSMILISMHTHMHIARSLAPIGNSPLIQQLLPTLTSSSRDVLPPHLASIRLHHPCTHSLNTQDMDNAPCYYGLLLLLIIPLAPYQRTSTFLRSLLCVSASQERVNLKRQVMPCSTTQRPSCHYMSSLHCALCY